MASGRRRRYRESVEIVAELVAGCVTGGALGSVALDHGLFRRISERLDHSLYCGPANQPAVALTFDDGPGPQTLELLALLRAEGVRATFFQCGMQVERYPEIARQVLAEGHQLGNHSWSHPSLRPSLPRGLKWLMPGNIHRELARTQRTLAAVTGVTPRFFRPPYGHRWVGLDRVVRRLGMRCVQWTVIGHDWEWGAGKIAPHVLERARPGAIVCLHDGRDVQPTADIRQTLEALRVIIPALRARGLRFETVSGLLGEVPANSALQVS